MERPTVRNAGPDAGITSLKVRGDFVYGTTWHFGAGGNLEGTFKASVATGDMEWVTDCHGDVYSSFLHNGVVYTASHAHYCGNMGGGHPQYPTWRFQYAQAWTDAVGGEILNEVHGYPNWHGVESAPSMVNWLPELAQGTFTGQGQAGWNVTGNNDYVVYGGEFPRDQRRRPAGPGALRPAGDRPAYSGPALRQQPDRADARADLTDIRAGELDGRLRPRRLLAAVRGLPSGHRRCALHDVGQLELVDLADARASSTPVSHRERRTATGSSFATPTTTSSTAAP